MNVLQIFERANQTNKKKIVIEQISLVIHVWTQTIVLKMGRSPVAVSLGATKTIGMSKKIPMLLQIMITYLVDLTLLNPRVGVEALLAGVVEVIITVAVVMEDW